MKDKNLLAVIAVVSFVLLLVIFWYFRQERQESLHPGYSGRVEAETVHFTSKVAGRVAAIHAEEGELLPAGSIILKLHFPELEARMNQAEGAIAAARANHEMAVNGATEFDLGRAQASLDAAEAQYDLAERSAERISAMFSDSLIAAQDYDEVMARYRAASAEKEAAALQLADLQAGTRSEQISMAEAELQRALAAREELRALYEEHEQRTDKRLMVESVNLQMGELAPSGYTLVSGYLPDEVHIRVSMPESETGKFPNGKRVKATLTATDEELELEVTSRRALPGYAVRSTAYPHSSFDEQWFEVRLHPVADGAQKIPGNGAQVIIHL